MADSHALDGFKICEYSSGGCYYKVDNFLAFINKQDKKWLDRLDAFTSALDKRVHIDKSDKKIKPIYRALDDFVQWIATELKTKIPHIYADMDVISTGSQTSGVKVGLHHEADFLFKLSNSLDDIEFLRETKIRQRATLTHASSHQLCDDIASIIDNTHILRDSCLQIHGIYQHEIIPGVCLVMSFAENSETRVGVTAVVIIVKHYHI